MKKNNFLIKHIYIYLLFIVSFSNAQNTSWPILQQNAQHNIISTVGEYRAGHFHGGEDISNPAGADVYATVSGTATIISLPANNNYNSRVIINGIYYWHTIATITNGATVTAGTKIGTSAPITTGAHVHVQSGDIHQININLISDLNPFIDNALPAVISVAYYQNGLLRNSNTTKFTNNVSVGGIQHKELYNKVDIMAKVSDPGTNVNGTGNSNTTMPYITSFQILDNENVSVLGPIENIKYDATPSPSSLMNFTFFSAATKSNHQIIITNNPFGTPYDRYWNTGLRKNVNETWPNNTSKDARYGGEALYPDGTYTIRVVSKDRDHGATPKNSSVNHDDKVLIDNFFPYIQKVLLTPNGTATPFTASWLWNGTQLAFNNYNPNSMVFNNSQNVVVKAFASEPLTNCFISIPNLNVGTSAMTVVPNTNNMQWKFTITIGMLASATDSVYKMVFTGHDYASHQLLRKAGNNMPIRQLDGSWLPNAITGNDTNFRFLFCPKPSNYHLFDLTSSYVGTDWKYGATSYNYWIYDVPGWGGWHMETGTFKPVYWINLQPSTFYQVKMSCNCGNLGVLSPESNVLSFTTPVAVMNGTTAASLISQTPVVIARLVGTGDRENEKLSVLPNPIRSGALLTIEGIEPRDIIKIVDMQGRIIFRLIVQSPGFVQMNIDKKISPGLYTLQIEKNDRILKRSHKVIIE